MKSYLEFCIKQDTDLIRNIIQFLKLVASCNLLFLAKINLLTIQFRKLAFEHEFMLLLSLFTLFALAVKAKHDGVGEEIAILVVETETHIYTLHLVGNRLALVETLIVWLLVVIRLFLLRISTETSQIPCFFLMLTCNTEITTS